MTATLNDVSRLIKQEPTAEQVAAEELVRRALVASLPDTDFGETSAPGAPHRDGGSQPLDIPEHGMSAAGRPRRSSDVLV